MRAIIREILARRVPAPPEEFVAIQVSRLNEALLVAYSAMTGMNLKAVDRVVRIVRELDRYHGFQPAVRQRSRLELASEEVLALGVEPDSRLALPPQGFGEAQSAPGVASGILNSQAESPDLVLSPSKDAPAGPENSPQGPEKVKSAPGILTVAETRDAPAEPDPAASLPYAASNKRPEIPAQPLEKAQSEPETERPPGEASAPSGPIALAPAPSPGGPRFCNVRMTPNGIAAC